MKKNTPKLLSTLLSIILIIGTLASSVTAIDFKKGTNTVSDSYRSGVYYDNLSILPHTGDGRTDALAVALSQLGYTEGNSNGEFSGTVAGGTQNFTEYNYNMGSFGSGYGGKDYPWCASFVSFCLLQAGCHDQSSISDWCRKNEGDSKYIWREVSCSKWANQLRTCGYFESSVAFDGDYEPIAGDLIFFTSNGVTESHIGLVLYSDGSKVWTVEGNTSSAAGLEVNGGGVYVKSYSLSSSYIRGYGILPYKNNNFSYKIDYSGARPSTGIYVATTAKYVYLSEEASTYSYVLPKYTLFNVIDTTDNGRLKVICEINGQTVTGFVKNNSDRVIQLSSDSNADTYSYSPIENTWGLKKCAITSYKTGSLEHPASSKPSLAELTLGDELTLCGWAGFTREISSIGYCFDKNTSDPVWDDDALLTADSSVTSAAGAKAKKYSVVADTSSLTAGKHSVCFVMKLSDGTITAVDNLDFVIRNKNDTLPDAPTLESFTENSITLKAIEGYEYSLGDGAWQSSPTFEWLQSGEGITYSFVQRIAKTDTILASVASEPLVVDMKKLNDASKLISLSFDGISLSPSFDPDVTEYSIVIPAANAHPEPTVSAADGTDIKIESTVLSDGTLSEIRIILTPTLGNARIYTIKVTSEPETTEAVTTDVPTDTKKDETSLLPPETVEITESVESESVELTSDIMTESTVITTDAPTESETEKSTQGCMSSLSAIPFLILCLCAIIPYKRSDKND